jgi:glycosyltransferase domain-containing protein
MFEEITLLVPTHNRHHYLDRILSYYKDFEINVLVADSSEKEYELGKLVSKTICYHHFPGVNLPQKLAMALKKVNTEFVVMCADDDFIVPNGILACLDFLKKRKDFASAQGNTICYHKATVNDASIKFMPMYLDQLTFSINGDNSIERISALFIKYRTLFCAVHYTENLRKAYNDALHVKNLFLNEYLSGIIPISTGKHMELNIFYQVREYADDSGDKLTDNLDVIIHAPEYRHEYKEYINFISAAIAKEISMELPEIATALHTILESYATSLQTQAEKKEVNQSLKKRIGNLISVFPVFGKKMVMYNREKERNFNLSRIVKTKEENNDLIVLERKITEYADAIK